MQELGGHKRLSVLISLGSGHDWIYVAEYRQGTRSVTAISRSAHSPFPDISNAACGPTMLPFTVSTTSVSARLLHPESCYITQSLAVAGDQNILELF